MDKNKVMMIVIIVLLVVLLGIIGTLTFFFLNSGIFGGGTDEPDEEEVISLSQDDIKLYTLEDSIYTNLLKGEDNKEHVGRLSLSLGIDATEESDATEFITKLSDNKEVIKDVVIGILRNKTYEELRNADGQEILRNEIVDKLRKQFDSNLIFTVYISDLMVQ